MWQKHLVLCRDRRDFESKYRMTEETFHKLVDVLSPRLDVNVEKSRNSSSGMQPLDKRFIVAVGLRWLAGCDHNGLDEIYGISRSSSHRLVDRFIDAVNCNINNINPPEAEEVFETIATAWTLNSSGRQMLPRSTSCVGWFVVHPDKTTS
jgi:hypothetical protein